MAYTDYEIFSKEPQTSGEVLLRVRFFGDEVEEAKRDFTIRGGTTQDDFNVFLKNTETLLNGISDVSKAVDIVKGKTGKLADVVVAIDIAVEPLQP